MGYVSYNQSTSNGRVRGSNGQWYTCPTTYYTSFVYHDTFGVQHPFPGSTTINTSAQPPQCDPLPSQPTYSGTANDGSGYTLNITNYTKANLTSSTGKQVNPASGGSGPTGAGSAVDSNGNEITADGSGHFTDTVGVSVLTVGGGAPNPETFSYTDSNGHQQTAQINYAQYTVQTNFGCSVSEYGPTASYLVSSVVFPDGSTYSFQYEATPNISGKVTGRIASVTLPQGGTISYTYTNGGVTGESGTIGSEGIMCADGSTSGLTRQIAATEGSPASTWSYSRVTGSGTSATQVTDGLSNVSLYNFVEGSNQPAGTTAAYYETNRAFYQGSAAGTPLLARQTCYNAQAPSCTTQSLTLPVSQIDTYQTLNGGEENGSTLSYDAYGDLTEEQDYDFGSGSRGPLLRKELWTYGGSIVGLATEDQVYDSAGLASQTMFGYDGTTLSSTSGVPQHVAVTGPRGNLTGIDQYTGPGAYLFSSAQYYDTGGVKNATTPNGTSTYGYESTYTFLTNSAPPTPSSGVALGSSATYDSYTGLQLSNTDPNNAQQTYGYDSMMRPTAVTNPDGGHTAILYNNDSNPSQTGYHLYQSAGVFTDVENLLDSYGRQSTSAVSNGQSSMPWYQQDTCYDGDGNVSFQSYRYQGNGVGSAKICTPSEGPGDAYTYDALGRVLTVTHADSTTVSYSYSGRATKVTDENNVVRVSQIDGLGRLTYVCEVSSNGSMPGGSGSPSSCHLDITATGFLTSYAYSLYNHSTTVTQGTQTRTFQTDWLGRPTLVQEPESGQTTYSYSYNSTGLVVTRVRPRANPGNGGLTTTTTTQYDSVGRVLSISYNDGTPTKSFTYDQATAWGGAGWYGLGASKGHLTEHTVTADGNWTGATYGYDPMGRVVWEEECTPSICNEGGNIASYTYDWLGNLLTAGNGVGGTDTYTYSPANEVLSITSSISDSTHPPNLVSNVQNGPFGPLNWRLGNGLAGIRAYDALGRPSGGWVCVSSSQSYCTGTEQYSYTSSWRGSDLISAYDTTLSQSNSYGYDEFGRLTSLTVNSGAPGNYSWVYDRWGNRWNQSPANGGLTENVTFNSNNQINSSGFGYDGAGNLLADGFHSYTYDAEGNVTKVDSGNTATYSYDALNRRVRIDQPGSDSIEFVYNPAGQHISSLDVTRGSGQEDWAYWGATPVVFDGNNQTNFEHQDWLGTERARTTYSGLSEGSFISLPFGDGLTTTTGTDWDAYHFASLDHDYSSDTDHAQFRQFANASGRWMSPDPYSGSYDFTNPQSMNRFAYVLGNPLVFADPMGSGIDCHFQVSQTAQYSPDGGETWQAPVYQFGIVCQYDGGGGSSGENALSGGGGSVGGGGAPNNGTPVHGPWTYGNHCGPGGMGPDINGTDAACHQHDDCYDSGGFTPVSNFRGHNAQLQACNQQLCNAARARLSSLAIPWLPSLASTSALQEAEADREINFYFTWVVAPGGNSCH
jgi:RHS repeat-associated protein